MGAMSNATGTVADNDGGETHELSAEPDLINRLEPLECDEIVTAPSSRTTIAPPCSAGMR